MLELQGIGSDPSSLLQSRGMFGNVTGLRPNTDIEQGIALIRSTSKDDDPEEVRKAATLLESHFLTMLLRELRTPLFDTERDEYFAPSRAEETFTSQLDEALGDSLAERRDLGLADLIIRQLLPEQTADGPGGSIAPAT